MFDLSLLDEFEKLSEVSRKLNAKDLKLVGSKEFFPEYLLEKLSCARSHFESRCISATFLLEPYYRKPTARIFEEIEARIPMRAGELYNFAQRFRSSLSLCILEKIDKSCAEEIWRAFIDKPFEDFILTLGIGNFVKILAEI